MTKQEIIDSLSKCLNALIDIEKKMNEGKVEDELVELDCVGTLTSAIEEVEYEVNDE